MPLARRTGEHGARARAAVPAARKAEQATAEQVRGEVLLRDGDLAALPARAELVQERQDDAGEHGSRGVVGEQAVERGVRGGVVELLECAAELGSGSRRRRELPPGAGGSEPACLAASAAESPVRAAPASAAPAGRRPSE